VPFAASRGPDTSLIHCLRHGLKRLRASLADGEHYGEQAGHEVVGGGNLGSAAERAGMVEIGGIAELGAAPNSARSCSTSTPRSPRRSAT
jgi:hypothetical protein